MTMPIARITGQGLTLIGLLVVLLWACLIGEKVTLRQAQAEYARAMRDVRVLRLRQQPVPVSLPVRRPARPPRPLAG
jgi:hypothetical protein